MSNLTYVASGLPLLSLLLIMLPAGALLIWAVPGTTRARWIALATALAHLALSLVVLWHFDAARSDFQLVEYSEWIPSIGVRYLVGIDGISVAFLPLTALLFIGVILASWTSVRTMPKLYFALLLLLHGATLGIFVSLDAILFFVFWELTLIPLYFLISLWGVGPNRRFAASKYVLFMLAGGVPLLFGFLLLAFNHAAVSGLGIPDGLAFDYLSLQYSPLGTETQTVVFLLLLIGFGIKTPLFPFHTWLPTVAMEGPATVAAIITGLKLGAYGLIRFAIPMAPQASVELHWLLAGLGTFGMVYGAVIALQESNLRRMLAYSSISHVGLVVLGLSSFSQSGTQGAVLQLMNFSVVSAGLFLLAGFLHHRTGSNDVMNLGGAARTMPLLAAFVLLAGFASMGIPGTNGFPAEFLLILSTLRYHTGAGIAALLATVLTAAYFLSLYRKMFFGPVRNSVVADATDLGPRELTMALVMGAMIIAFGLYPQALIGLSETSVGLWVARLGGGG